LPDDIGRECLLRVPLRSHSDMAAVCKRWKNTVKNPIFYQDRKKLGFSQHLIIVVDEANPTSLCESGYRLSIYDPLQNSRQILRSVPTEFQHYSYNSYCVSVNHKLIVMGLIKEAKEMVFVYDFSSGRWNRGADHLPHRNYFCCSVDCEKGLIYVAGGRDKDNKELRKEASVYNVEENSWELLPSMTWGVDSTNYNSGFIDGKLLLVCMWSGRLQIYDTKTSVWKALNACALRHCGLCMAAFSGLIHYFEWEAEVIEYNIVENQWRVAGTVPDNLRIDGHAVVWRDKIFVWGLDDGNSEKLLFYLFEPSRPEEHFQAAKPDKWTPINAENWIFSLAALEI
ncbi:hypothetical protein KI387_018773, partial [Taxus chinensis]